MFDEDILSNPDQDKVDFLNPPESTPKGAQDFSMKAQQEKFLGGSSLELKSPYCVAFMELAKKEIPENANAMGTILEDIDRQSVDNFNLFKSEQFPGTEISYIKLKVTPALVREIAETGGASQTQLPLEDAEESLGKDEVAFLFTAMGKPPDGNAFAAQDIGIDRFIRYLPRIARAIKMGEPIPNVEVYLLGAGTGYGEKVSPDFVKSVREKGLDVRGQLYSEFVQQVLANKDLDNTHVLLQGVSMGTTTADRTFSHLPDRIKKISQRLFDNPAGTHDSSLLNKWRGIQAAVGLGAEFVAREMLDPVAKTLGRTREGFIKHLFEERGLKTDSPEDKKNKDDLFRAAGFKLFGGASLNLKDERSYIRQGIKDPLTTTPARIARVMMRKGKKIETHSGQQAKIQVPMRTRERALETPTGKTHFFIYENFPRFNQIINYCKSVPASRG